MPPAKTGRGQVGRWALLAAFVLAVRAAPGLLSAHGEVLWERNRFWASSETTYFEGVRCRVDTEQLCPRRMGWQGNRLVLDFPLPRQPAGVDNLRFEIAVDNVSRPLGMTIEAGAVGEAHDWRAAERIEAPGIFRVLIPVGTFVPGRRNEIVLRGDNPVGYGEPRGIRWLALGLYAHWERPPALSPEELLDDTQFRACLYFYEQAFSNGFVRDTMSSPKASIAATGFGAAVMTIFAKRYGTTPRWTVPPYEARNRVAQILTTVLAIQERQSSDPARWGWAGIPYHFVDKEGRRYGNSEVSTIDGALLATGLLQAGVCFGGEILTNAQRVFHNMDFGRFLRPDRRRYSHGWRPEKGLLEAEWDRPSDETLLVCLLSLAQAPDDSLRLKAWYSFPRAVEAYAGIPVVRSYFGSLFTYTFAHFWIPFWCVGSDTPSRAGMTGVRSVDWWENSRNAVRANRRYHEDRRSLYPSLGAEAWGASACYRADRVEYFGTNGTEPSEAPAAFDGTVPPYGAIMSIFLAQESPAQALSENPSFRALRAYYENRFSTLWCSYGPRSSFDSAGNVSPMVVGIEKGPEALGIEVYRTGRPACDIRAIVEIREALSRLFVLSECPAPLVAFVRGQVNNDAEIDIADAVFLLSYLFGSGPPPMCADAADANDDGALDLADAVAILSYLFAESFTFPPPFPHRGFDTTEDELPPCVGAKARGGVKED